MFAGPFRSANLAPWWFVCRFFTFTSTDWGSFPRFHPVSVGQGFKTVICCSWETGNCNSWIILKLGRAPRASLLLSTINGGGVFRLLRIWRDWRKSYLNGAVWMDWANQHLSKVKYGIKSMLSLILI